MALKDWKKQSKNIWYKRTEYKHGFLFVEIEKNEVVISIEGNINKIINVKLFKTKSLALKLAKSYMRTH